MDRGLPALALALILVLAGCAAPASTGARGDPAVDQIGWENSYWYDDPVRVTTDDGLNESEREVVVARAMARVEHIRQLEFRESVPVEVTSREAFQEGRNPGGAGPHETWNNQVWEALLLVGENENVSAAFGSTLGSSVQGYYAPGEGKIVIVSDAETPTIDRATLAHELVHALQDQHFTLGGSPPTQDRQLATDGVVEGDANVVQRRYEDRCGFQWDCIDRPERNSGGGDPFNMGLFVTIFTPYAAGPGFVDSVYQSEGWEGVDRLYDRFPASTEQVIHPDRYPDERPVNVTVQDRSGERWNRFDISRQPTDTVGEASIYAMLWANGAVEREGRSVYQYDHPLSDGWAGDTVVPYRNGDRFGYVWVIAWDSPAEAREFRGAYRDILDNRSVRQPEDGVYVLPESDPFGDAFRVTRSGNRVRIVNGPTVRALDRMHDAG
jgi:hypothetical protein